MPRVIFITGASSGIGSALAPLYAQKGDYVALIARRSEHIKEVANAINNAGGHALPIPCDVTDREAVHSAVRRCESTLGPVDIMIANAGVGLVSRAARLNGERLKTMFDVNVLGATYCFEAVIPGMLDRGKGHLVGVSSMAGYRGLPGAPGYSATKAALTNMMESMRVELTPKGIACTTICPGFIRTEMTSPNKHPMPFLLEVDDAAERIYKAIEKKKSEYAFPWQMAALIKSLHLLPNPIFDRIGRLMGV